MWFTDWLAIYSGLIEILYKRGKREKDYQCNCAADITEESNTYMVSHKTPTQNDKFILPITDM